MSFLSSYNNSGIHYKLIAKEMGFVLALEAILIFISWLVSIHYKESCAEPIAWSAGITLTVAILLSVIGFNTQAKSIHKRDSVITVTLTWLLFSIFGMLPFYISGTIPSFTDAFFETASGLTTTGSTILTDVEAIPKGLLFWRSLTQWMGGLGMIVFVLAFLPLIASGGSSQLYEEEVTGIAPDKFRPRIGQIAKRLWGIYCIFTLLLYFLLVMGPMDSFDAWCHAFTTMSTGGYSTKQESIAYWNSPYIDYTVSIFMLVGATNFTLWYFLFKGGYKKFLQNEEIRWFLSIVVITTIIITAGLRLSDVYASVEESFRYSFFQVVSLITTTGFGTADFSLWGPFYWVILSLLMLICGCAGSTSGGLKVIRFLVLSKNTINEFKKQVHPNAILPVRVNGSVISTDVVQRILAFSFIYIVIIFISMLVFTAAGLNFQEAWSVAISGISNVGPGLENYGSYGNFAGMPSFAKWYYSFLMIVGRLELFTVLILFTPGFWKR